MFGEDEFSADAQGAADQLVSDLASTDDVTVIASQGGVIPALMTWLSPSGAPEPMPQVAAKAGAWTLAFGPGRMRADYYPPPKR